VALGVTVDRDWCVKLDRSQRGGVLKTARSYRGRASDAANHDQPSVAGPLSENRLHDHAKSPVAVRSILLVNLSLGCNQPRTTQHILGFGEEVGASAVDSLRTGCQRAQQLLPRDIASSEEVSDRVRLPVRADSAKQRDDRRDGIGYHSVIQLDLLT
jgi:hypothetical protein